MKKSRLSEEEWSLIISSKHNLLNIPLLDIWQFRDLLYMFIKRDIITLYKQTILGPVWFFIQPLLTVAVYIVVFNRIARLPTDGLPPILFYLSGIIIWNYFQESFITTSKTFVENANLFGKVYFPRIILPMAKVSSGLIRFLIQLVLFLAFYCYYILSGYSLNLNLNLLLLPVLILIMVMLGLGLGILFTSLTTKYRDLVFLIQFGVQLLMYATPVIYPLSAVPAEYHILFYMNPMTAVLEGFRFSFFGTGIFTYEVLIVGLVSSLFIFLIGMIVFNNVQRNFMDTV